MMTPLIFRPLLHPRFLSICACVSALACSSQSSPQHAPPPPPPEAPAEHVPPPLEERAPSTAEDLGIRILSDVGFSTPESVVHDEAQDVYFVSNIHGAPLERDGNGFISKLSPAGEVQARFIAGGVDGVTLHAPKGLAVHEGVLYVCDIDRVRSFDSTTGEPLREIVIPGSTFLNDISFASDGSFYVSDSGLQADFSNSGTDAVYKVQNGQVEKILGGKDMGSPNGLWAEEGGVWVVHFSTQELYFLRDDGKKEQLQKLPLGSNDGIVRTAEGRFFISSWEGSSVLVGSPGGEFVESIRGVDAPADLGYDSKRNRLLIPLFKKNSVIFHSLVEGASAPSSDSSQP